MRLLSWLRDWWAFSVPTDEQLAENDKALRGRVGPEHHRQYPTREQLAECGTIARRQLSELHTTKSPLHRRAS